MQSSAEFCLRRISKRNRNSEDSYTLEYLENLKTYHDKFLLKAKFIQSDHDHQLTEQGFIPEQTLNSYYLNMSLNLTKYNYSFAQFSYNGINYTANNLTGGNSFYFNSTIISPNVTMSNTFYFGVGCIRC